ncbi:MAG: dockerin type I domain-containing protein, partial [Syntrophales bacterium]|nr:dockerin type I domain-containing protein [Syntrophales bacterium]
MCIRDSRYTIAGGSVEEITPSGEQNPFGDIYKISWNTTADRLAYDRWPIGIHTFTPGVANLQVLDIPRASQMDTPSMAGWHPGGQKLAFVKDLYNAARIGVYETATGTTYLNGDTQDRWPVWAPNGSQMAVVHGEVNNGNIWILTTAAVLKGDLNGDGQVNMADAILALQAAAGLNPTGIRSNYATSGADVNGDNKAGIAEVLYIIQTLAGARP